MRKAILSIIMATACFITAATPVQAKNRTDYLNVTGTSIYVAPDVSIENISTELSFYNKLDPGVIQALCNTGIRYYIINEKNDNTKSGHTGDTVFADDNGNWYENSPLSIIWCEGRLGKDIKYGGTVMNHEIGHVIDILYDGGTVYDRLKERGCPDGASVSEEWKSLYKTYKSTISGFGGLSKYEVYNATEAFAEAYAHYAVNPSMVREKAPEIANYMDKVNADVIYHFAPEMLEM